jgi:hypothetical protein
LVISFSHLIFFLKSAEQEVNQTFGKSSHCLWQGELKINRAKPGK